MIEILMKDRNFNILGVKKINLLTNNPEKLSLWKIVIFNWSEENSTEYCRLIISINHI